MNFIDCPRCRGRYVDPSPVAALNPRPCPYCTGNTSAAPTAIDPQGYEKAIAAARAIGPVPPEVTFYEVAGGVGAFLGDEPAGWMTRVQFEAMKQRLGGGSDGL